MYMYILHTVNWSHNLKSGGVRYVCEDVFLLKPIAKGFYLRVEIILPLWLLDKSSN